MASLFLLTNCEKDDENIVELPSISTLAVTEITATTAKSGGNVTNDNGGEITSKGIVWSTSQNPTFEQNIGITIEGAGAGLFQSMLTGLSQNTNYYVRSHATNSAGTAYGSQVQFKTELAGIAPEAAFITLTTSGTVPLTVQFSDQSTNNPTSWQWDFGDGITDTQQNPEHTYQNEGGYTVQLTVTNSYGSDTEVKNNYISVTSVGGTGQPCPGTPTVTDTDGNVYNTVHIGDQCWMKENLKTTKYSNGTPLAYPGPDSNAWEYNTTGAYAWYDNNISYKDIYGALYNYYAVNNTNGLCPSGWHVPSDDEWKKFEGTMDSQYGVGHDEWNGTGWRGHDVGKKLKATSGWNSNGNGTDDYGFGALAGGYRSNIGNFDYLGDYGFWWSATETSSVGAWSRILSYDHDRVSRTNGTEELGMSVRCLKD